MFINNLLTTDFDIAFVKSIMLLADNLQLDILAEGVEEQGQVDKLSQVGCRYVQGYYYSRPLPPSDAEKFIEDWGKPEGLKAGAGS